MSGILGLLDDSKGPEIPMLNDHCIQTGVQDLRYLLHMPTLLPFVLTVL